MKFYVSRPVPYPAERMVPRSAHIKVGGRGNPVGIAYLYLADSPSTAIAEARPWKHANVSVASFRITRDLKLLDLTLYPPASDDLYESVSTSTPTPEETEANVWSQINWAFATPVDPNDSQLEYTPTQALGEVFREAGFDGLLYASALAEGGKNYMLFRTEYAAIGKRQVFRVKRVMYEHEAIGEATEAERKAES